jgi:hypothetical protein
MSFTVIAPQPNGSTGQLRVTVKSVGGGKDAAQVAPVTLHVSVAVAVGVGVGVTASCSNKPMSRRPFTTRSKPAPRWSKRGGGVKLGLPILMAGLPGESLCVMVGPPLYPRFSSNGSVLIWSPGPVRKPPPSSVLRL